MQLFTATFTATFVK